MVDPFDIPIRIPLHGINYYSRPYTYDILLVQGKFTLKELFRNGKNFNDGIFLFSVSIILILNSTGPYMTYIYIQDNLGN